MRTAKDRSQSRLYTPGMSTVERIAMGYNNVYVVHADGGRVLVDAGPDYEGARELLEGRLDLLPGAVVATHGHLDHAGLGRYWCDRGVAVAIGAGDAHLARAPQLADPAEFEAMASFVRGAGAPADIESEVLHGLEERRGWALAAANAGPYPPAGRGSRWPTALHYEHFEPARLLADGDDSRGRSKY